MTNSTKIGDGKIPPRYQLIFIFGVVVGIIATVGYALDPYLPQPVKKQIKTVLSSLS